MGESPGRREERGSGAGAAFATSAVDNSTAFGYSIMITVTFGVISRVEGSGSVLDLFGFAAAASIAVGLINGAVTGGFRRRLKPVPTEIAMLGTALNFVSVALSVAAALAAAELLANLLAWAAGAFLASGLYVGLEGSEILLAEWIQSKRGDPDANV